MSGADTQALPYRRLPLDQSKKELRLVELRYQGSDDLSTPFDLEEEAEKPISMRMVKASLLKPPKFLALSYVWGPSSEGRSITLRVPQKADLKGDFIESDTLAVEEETLDSCEIGVTDNLFAALVHYRIMNARNQSDYIWIDALCINQRDNDEKSWQVAMMREVYKSAYLVLAWLGPYPDPLEFWPGEFIQTLKTLASEGFEKFGHTVSLPLTVQRNVEGSSFLRTDIVEWVRRVKIVPGPSSRSNGDGTYDISQWALLEFELLAFWRRVWILQEVMLANRILFQWVAGSIESSTLFVALRIIEKALQVAGERGPLSSTQGIGDVLRSEKTWIRASNTQERVICPMLARRHDTDYENDLWNLIHWNACARLHATMPADHIFGLFGVATDVEELGIRLDYNRDVADIYTEVASSCIKKNGLEVIADVQWPKKVRNLPSWVPDWSALASNGTRMGIWKSYRTSFVNNLLALTVGNFTGPRAYRFTVTPAGSPALIVAGNTITTVKTFLPTMRNASGKRRRIIRQIWDIQAKLVAAKDMIEQSATAYRTVQDRHTAFASTLVAGAWDRGRETYEHQWSLTKLIQGYKLLLDPVSVETSLNSLWRRQSPFHKIASHTIIACYVINERFLDRDPSTYWQDPVEIDGVPVTVFCHHPGLYYQIWFDDYADQVLGNLVHVEGAEETMARISMFMDRMGEVNLGRRLFLSTDGYLGLGPEEMKMGDVVAYLDGAEVPFILRQLSTGDFTLVGESYVYGLMDRDAKVDNQFSGFVIGPSPEIETTIHQCPQGSRREFVIV